MVMTENFMTEAAKIQVYQSMTGCILAGSVNCRFTLP